MADECEDYAEVGAKTASMAVSVDKNESGNLMTKLQAWLISNKIILFNFFINLH